MYETDLDHARYLNNMLATIIAGVTNDTRYSPERRAHASALMARFRREIAVALHLPRAAPDMGRHRDQRLQHLA